MAIRAYRTCGPRTQRNPTTAQPELEARSDPPRTDLPSTTAKPEFYRISDFVGTDNFLGGGDAQAAGTRSPRPTTVRPPPWKASTRCTTHSRESFWDDGAPGSYNVEELDEALERQAAEDAQRELDEAFERARQNLNEDVQTDSITVLSRSGIGIQVPPTPAER